MNSDTLAPTRKPRAATAPSGPKVMQSKGAVGPCDTTAIQNAFASIGKALVAACDTEESHDWSYDSDRLLRIASDIAEREAQRVHGGYEAENFGFDIAALIKAARLVPGDTESPKRTALLEAVEANLIVLTGCADCLKTGAVRPASPNADPIEVDPTSEAQEDDAEKERRQLAAACTLEIEKLAQATKTVCDFGDNYPVINGIMGRIAQLSEVIYLAMRLHGESDEEYEAYDHRAMEASFEGRLP